MTMSSTYVSVFKIDGVPILPPVMTKQRREEMRFFREMAIKVEQRLVNRRKERPGNDSVDTLVPDPVPKPAEHIPEDCDDTATSETLPTDVYSTQLQAQPLPPVPVGQPSQEPLPVDDSMNLTPTSPQHEENQPDSVQFDTPKLIRSNSYTLDQPSPMLQKFLDSFTSTANTVHTSPRKKLSKSASTTAAKSPLRHGNRNKNTPRRLSGGVKTSPIKKVRHESLDDTKRRLKIHSNGEQVEKFFMKSKTVKDLEDLVTKSSVAKGEECEENKENVDVSVEQRKDEEEEQTVVHKTSTTCIDDKEQQQNRHRLIINKLEQLNLMDRTSTPVQRIISPEPEDAGNPNLNETSFYSTIRGESPLPADINNHSMSLVSDAYSKQYLQSLRSFTMSPTPRLQRENEDIAATIINSHVRGYLTRRLQRTELVQNIIDNIKNILFTILDANPKEIQLKRSYLQQLNANCEKLHDVFFKYSVKERMDVIAKDRELLLQRLSQRRAKRSISGGGRLTAIK